MPVNPLSLISPSSTVGAALLAFATFFTASPLFAAPFFATPPAPFLLPNPEAPFLAPNPGAPFLARPPFFRLPLLLRPPSFFTGFWFSASSASTGSSSSVAIGASSVAVDSSAQPGISATVAPSEEPSKAAKSRPMAEQFPSIQT